jgi:hypothetical protein
MKMLSKIVILILFTATFAEINAQVAVIANKNLVVDAIDINSLKNIYEINSNEISGNKVILFNLSLDDLVTEKFYSGLGTTFGKIKKVWLRAKLTGNGNLPKNVSSEEMLKEIASTEGAIGFISADKVNSEVKVLLKIN